MMFNSSIYSRFLIRHYAKSAFIRVRSDVFEKILNLKPQQIKWDNIRNDLMKNEMTVNKNNIDGIILSKCFNGAQLDLALSYIDFLKSNSLNINDGSISKLIRLYYNHYRNKNIDLTHEDEEEIIKYCDLISNKHQFVDTTTAENIIHGLSMTRDWQKSFKFLEQVKLSGSVPSTSTFSCLISRAIKENRHDIVWGILNEMAEKQIMPKTYIFIEWMKNHEDDSKKIAEMFEFISENSLLLPEVQIQNITESLKKSYNCTLVTINRTGKCPSCAQKLPGVKLLQPEFSKLATRFLNDIFIRSDVFLKSSPDEVTKFKDFVDKTAPYDSVIDGLNVAYSQGNRLSPKIYAKTLAQVVKYFVDKNQKCLVIGRQHMKSWPRKEMSYIKENSLLFLAEDLSNDDVFLLYAALKSGPNTNLFSCDLMRQHSHLLSQKLKSVFRRWQQEHQYQLITTKMQNRVLIKEPILFELRAHKVNSTWHLPFTNENHQSTLNTFNLPTSWLCLKER